MKKPILIDFIKEIKNSDELDKLGETIVLIMNEFNQQYSEFNQKLSNYYIKELKSKLGKNISEIRAKTGFTKAVVEKGLNDSLIQTTDFINKQKFLLAEAYSQINRYCFLNKAQHMPKIELYRTMQTFADGHVSIKSHLDRLIKTGFIGVHENYVFIDLSSNRKQRTNDDYLRFIVEGIKRLTSTVIYNKNKSKNQVSLFERRLRSTQTPPTKSTQLTNELNDILNESYEKIAELFTRYEEDVPVNTYEEITVQLFLFNNNFNKKGENHEDH